MTNGTLIQFMNYAVVMVTLIKMRQCADHFVYELMIYAPDNSVTIRGLAFGWNAAENE